VEAVTKRFFAEYHEVFERVETAVKGVPKGEPRRLYVQRLFNRLMFLYFIQRKGWLSFQGDKKYLRALFNAATAAKEDFLNDRLFWTFFHGLNTIGEDKTVHSDAKLKERRGDVPFLNGGLFDLEDEYDVHHKVAIPNNAFAAVFDLFDRYNFTVTESTPLDIEVAVDPEMLGKVFEELVTGRHETGSYYTPRPIVAFMCRESLKHYLAAQLSSVSANPTDEAAIAHFVDDGDPTRLPDPEAVLNALRGVKVCDPACGSGAYLLGMMQELLRLREALFATRGLDAVTVYKRKLEIIQNNLYGVDIDLFAVNIAKLRLWLSLAVDFEGAKPPPLPNLDFKIECGDSLTAPNPQEISDLFRHMLVERADQLAELKGKFLQTYGAKKKELAKRIRQEEANLSGALSEHSPDGSVDWRVSFAEVFKNAGFNVIVANPPYGIDGMDSYGETVCSRDSYSRFIGLAASLVRKTGVCAYIVPTSWETGERFTSFRRWFLNTSRIIAVVNLPYDVFEIPFVDTCVVLFEPKASTLQAGSLKVLTMQKREARALETIAERLRDLPVANISGDRRLRLLLRAQAADVFQAVSEKPRLSSAARLKRGIEAYKYKILPSQRSNAWLPFFQGKTSRYCVKRSAEPLFVKVTDAEEEWHRAERLVIRRLVSRANRLMAARMKYDVVVKKDLYVLKCTSSRLSLSCLLGILNSSLLSYLYLARSAAATKDDFRQVSLEGLRDLPLPDDLSRLDEVANLVEQIEKRVKEANEWADLDQQLDSLIFDIYGISTSQRVEVSEFLSAKG
jgi:type I restriction-modification system DNA methylase subunit